MGIGLFKYLFNKFSIILEQNVISIVSIAIFHSAKDHYLLWKHGKGQTFVSEE